MITAIILTKNEEKYIEACLESLAWCSEIIVIDDNSSDSTVELAKKRKAIVFTRNLNGDFSAQRNFGLEKASNEWVLFIDADERISLTLQYEIMGQISSTLSEEVGYFIKRRDVLWGKELQYGEVGNIKLLRLAKKYAGKWHGKVHEVWKVRGKTATLNNILMHYPHASVNEFLKEINYYTSLRAKELASKKTKVSVLTIVSYPIAKFTLNYFLRLGFLDGIRGLILALLMSFHSFLVRGKLWTLSEKM